MTELPTDRRTSANPTESVFAVHSRGQSTEVSSTSGNPASASGAPLAQRAVTTVLNVINAQDIRPAGNGVVNLHFKFGNEDLSVRVAMRGNEVHTQFNTSSTELRNALATEWRGVAGDSDSSLRLVEPTFSSSGGSDQQLGSGAQGNPSQRDFAQQQPSAQLILPAASAFTEESTAPADNALPSRLPGHLHTSLHLAAVA